MGLAYLSLFNSIYWNKKYANLIKVTAFTVQKSDIKLKLISIFLSFLSGFILELK